MKKMIGNFLYTGQKDSNLRITEPKTVALPLGYAPNYIIL